jgi:hypothetical protein
VAAEGQVPVVCRAVVKQIPEIAPSGHRTRILAAIRPQRAHWGAPTATSPETSTACSKTARQRLDEA